MKNIDPLNAITEGDQVTPHFMVVLVKMDDVLNWNLIENPRGRKACSG
jgi:predicted Fe-Mo cluster-binding NifX family protein